MKLTNKLTIFGSSFKFGQMKDGVQKAPSEMSELGIASKLISLGNNVRHYGMIYPKRKDTTNRTVGYYTANLARKVFQERKDNRRILNIGGDHSVAIGSINGILEHDPNTIIIWIDAHSDINTIESSPSGNFHGMPLAFLTGLDNPTKLSKSKYLNPKLKFDSLALLGIRDLDKFEKDIIKRHNILNFTTSDIKKKGYNYTMYNALANLDPTSSRPIYISFDIDVLDPDIAKGTGTLAKNGVSVENIFGVLDYLRNTGRVIGMDMVEVNPALDTSGDTVRIAMQCIERVFDKRT